MNGEVVAHLHGKEGGAIRAHARWRDTAAPSDYLPVEATEGCYPPSPPTPVQGTQMNNHKARIAFALCTPLRTACCAPDPPP